jgi:hypothetical protein
MLGVLVRLAADATLIALALFASAGTLAWSRAWGMLAVLLVVRTVTAVAVYRVNPALIRERARLPIHGDQPWADRLLLLAVVATGFVGLPAIAGLDVIPLAPAASARTLHQRPRLALFTLGWMVKGSRCARTHSPPPWCVCSVSGSTPSRTPACTA